MKKISLFFFFYLSFFISQIIAQIIPAPQQVKVSNGFFVLPKQIKISFVNDLQSECIYPAQIINKALKDYKNIISKVEPEADKSQIVFMMIDSTKLQNLLPAQKKYKEAYKVIVNPSLILIQAYDGQGAFYAAQSVAQLIAHANENKIPTQEIVDYPMYERRGLSDDISRGQISNLQNFKRIFEQMARFKMNTYFLYIEDAVLLDSYSSIGKEKGALSKGEIKEILYHAQKNFIEVIPIFETLGHQENILIQPAFQKMAEFEGAMSLCVECPFTYQYLEKAIGEISKLFPSNYFHIGGDESFDAGISKSKDLADSIGIANLHLEHYKKVYNICKKNGKKVMMYGDMLEKFPHILKQIPEDIIIIDWQYDNPKDYPSTHIFSQAKQEYWLSTTVFNFKTIFPLHNISFPSTQNLASIGLNTNAKGFITSNWGDMGNDSPKELLYYLYAWTAQNAWSPTKSDATYFSNHFFALFFDNFNTTYQISNIYFHLIKPEQQINWTEFWRHPALPLKKGSFWQNNLDAKDRSVLSKNILFRLKRQLDTLLKTTKQGTEMLECWRWVVDMSDYFYFKTETSKTLHAFLSNLDVSQNQILSKIDENISELNRLQSNTDSLWKKFYKSEGSEYIYAKFTRLKEYWNEIKQSILAKQKPKILTEAKWIYASKGNGLFYDKAIFRKDFLIEELPNQVLLHLAADTHAEVYLNGQMIDKVFARNIFSIHIENELTKFIDLRPFIRLGTNQLEIRASNYNQGLKNSHQYWTQILGNLGAGINATLFIKDLDIENQIHTDSSWESTWIDESIKTKNIWKKSTEKKYHYDLIAPNFNTKRLGSFER
jgi:hypothetical protein